VHLLQLGGGEAARSVGAVALTALQFLRRAVHADEHHVLGDEQREAVPQAPLGAEDVVHDDVVTGGGHPGDGAVVAPPGAVQHRVEVTGVDRDR
jgi:hypothetical protein